MSYAMERTEAPSSFDDERDDVAKRVPDVTLEVQRLGQEIEKLEKVGHLLISRLATVTRPTDSPSDGTHPTPAPSCELAGQLADRREMVSRIQKRLSEVLDGLEV